MRISLIIIFPHDDAIFAKIRCLMDMKQKLMKKCLLINIVIFCYIIMNVQCHCMYSGFVLVNKSKIQGRFKDFQGHVSENLRTKMNC